MKKSNISIFIPHLGCPHKCSFCDQKAITSVSVSPSPVDVENTVKYAVLGGGCNPSNTEIAFFGGSFTAIEREYMISLLSVAKDMVETYGLEGIRISTRPDAIDEEIFSILKEYGVTAIELGAQSTNDNVLKLNHRGHTFDDIKNASNLIRMSGVSLGLQMMTGLYGSNDKTDIQTAEDIANLKPDTVRIYPAITLKNTFLATLYQRGIYIPPTLDDTISLCAKLLDFFNEQGINVIKLGLHSSTEVEKNYVAGPYHPSFRELCESKIYLNKATEVLKNTPQNQEVTIYVNSKCISKMIGNNKGNISYLADLGYKVNVKGKEDIPNYCVKI